MSRDELRVVFTGVAGIRKAQIVSLFRDYLHAHDAEWQKLNEHGDDQARVRRERALVGIYDVERSLGGMGQFLNTPPPHRPQKWREAVSDTFTQWRKANPKPKYAFLSMHMTFQTHSHCFSPLAWKTYDRQNDRYEHTLSDCLKEFDPHYLITLTENVHLMWWRVKQTGFPLRMADFLRWRDAEMLMTDTADYFVIRDAVRCDGRGQFPFEHSPLLAVGHPMRSLATFLLEPEKLRIYASFPMSRPRRYAREQGDNTPINEINRFRSLLHNEFTVFDPATIDEMPLQELLEQASGQIGGKVLVPRSLWSQQLPGQETLCGDVPEEIEADIHEIEEIGRRVEGQPTEIERHVRSRDYRYIDQSDCLVIYRPTYRDNAWTHGTLEEFQYASKRSDPKRIIVVRDRAHDGELSHPPLLHVEARDIVEGENLDDPVRQDEVFAKVLGKLEENAATLKHTRLRTPPKER